MHDFHPFLFPRELGRITIREHMNALTVDDQAFALDTDVGIPSAVNRIVLEQMSEGLKIAGVIYSSDPDSRAGEGKAKHFATDAAASIDSDHSWF
jgi:hypothetical protein